jgi:hypothetical protein
VHITVLAGFLVAGCGPFGYLKKVARESSKAVADAEAAGAEENAPYEYWGSVTYLEQAKILMGYSEYERSFDYGERAKQLAEEAKDKAEKRRRGEMVETVSETDASDGGDAEANADAEAESDVGKDEASGSVKAGVSLGGE